MSNSKISVYIRPRPIDDEIAWTITDDKKISKKDTGAPQFSFGLRLLIVCWYDLYIYFVLFNIDKVFRDTATQNDIYAEVTPIISSFLNGINGLLLNSSPAFDLCLIKLSLGTIMAYGQVLYTFF